VPKNPPDRAAVVAFAAANGVEANFYYPDLVALKIVNSRAQLRRLLAAGLFPRPQRLGDGRFSRMAWTATMLREHQAAVAARAKT
jgi:hypothetical protein